jgi:lysozyme family protein
MPDYFAQCFAFTVGEEGGFTDNPDDPGNWTGGAVNAGTLRGTKFGISAAQHPLLDIPNLTIDQAQAIYQRDYWVPVHGPDLAAPIALVAFDAAVNVGVGTSVRFLQEAAGVTADGKFGPGTEAALNAGDPVALATEALVRRIDFYTTLPPWKDFGLGWTRRVLALAVKLNTPPSSWT